MQHTYVCTLKDCRHLNKKKMLITRIIQFVLQLLVGVYQQREEKIKQPKNRLDMGPYVPVWNGSVLELTQMVHEYFTIMLSEWCCVAFEEENWRKQRGLHCSMKLLETKKAECGLQQMQQPQQQPQQQQHQPPAQNRKTSVIFFCVFLYLCALSFISLSSRDIFCCCLLCLLS